MNRNATPPLKKHSLIAGLFLVSLLSACGGGGGGDTSPSATSTTTTPTVPTTPGTHPALTVTAVTLNNATPTVGTALSFTGGVCGGGTGSRSVSWNFGDGSAASGAGIHTYTSPGSRSVTVTCSDSFGTTPVVSAPLNITIAAVAIANGFLGKTWSAYNTIDPSNGTLYPVAGLATSGDVYGVWLQSFTGGTGVAAGSTTFNSTSWTLAGQLPTGTDTSPFNGSYYRGRIGAIDISVSPGGKAMAAWMAGTSIWYATKNGASAWSAPVKITVPVLDASIKVVVNDAGNGAIAYCTSAGASVISYASATQTTLPPVTISSQCDVTISGTYDIQRLRSFDVAIDNATSTIYAVGLVASTSTPANSVIAIKTYNPAMGWTTATALSSEFAPTALPTSLSYSRAPNGSYAGIAWDQIGPGGKFNVYARIQAGGSWGVTTALQTNNSLDYSRPLIAVNDNGDAFLAMNYGFYSGSDPRTYVSNYGMATGWKSVPVQVESNRFNATDIAIDAWGNGLMVYTDLGFYSQAGTLAKNGTWSGFSTITPSYPSAGFHNHTLRTLPDGRAILVTSVRAELGRAESGYVLLK
jgi:hypothetical protein